MDGVVDDDCFPYEPHLNECLRCDDWLERSIPIGAWTVVSGRNAILSYLSNVGPVVGFMLLYEDFVSYAGGVYQPDYRNKIGGHALLIIGYDLEGDFWLCKNSFGSDWGEDGYCRIQIGLADLTFTSDYKYFYRGAI